MVLGGRWLFRLLAVSRGVGVCRVAAGRGATAVPRGWSWRGPARARCSCPREYDGDWRYAAN